MVSKHDEVMSKLRALKKLLQMDIDASSLSGKKLKKKSSLIKFFTIAISASMTVVIGLNLGDHWADWSKNLALVLSALLTALSGWDSFTKYEARYQQEHSNSVKLMMLYKDIILYESGNSGMEIDKYNEFLKRYQSLQEEYMEERKEIANNSSDEKQDISK